jgi:hypothetical protein
MSRENIGVLMVIVGGFLLNSGMFTLILNVKHDLHPIKAMALTAIIWGGIAVVSALVVAFVKTK